MKTCHGTGTTYKRRPKQVSHILHMDIHLVVMQGLLELFATASRNAKPIPDTVHADMCAREHDEVIESNM